MDKIIKLKGKFSTHKLIKLKSLLENSNRLVYKLELEDNVYREYFVNNGVCFFILPEAD